MINLSMPENQAQLRPKITVIGAGGAGGNAVNNMIRSKLEGVDFVVANTDAQALEKNLAPSKLQLGHTITRGLGAGSRPEIGQAAAEEQIDDIVACLGNSHMAFITAGMGGGTGTGAAPVIARIAREQGILTIGVVTMPFHFEGAQRKKQADAGVAELQKYVDTLIVIPNQNLFRIANENTTFADAFKMADDVLYSGVKGVTDLMIMPGMINLDFADIRSIMTEMGKAMMGTGESSGERRAVEAAEAAISNPLLDGVSMKGARNVLINITGGPDMTLFEVDEAVGVIREEVDPDAHVIFGSTFDEDMVGRIRITVVATGIEPFSHLATPQRQEYVKPHLVTSEPSVNDIYNPALAGQVGESLINDEEEEIHSDHFIPSKPINVVVEANTVISPLNFKGMTSVAAERHAHPAPKKGFFQRIKSLIDGEEEQTYQPAPQSHPMMRIVDEPEAHLDQDQVQMEQQTLNIPLESQNVERDENLAIPAFLRRQAH